MAANKYSKFWVFVTISLVVVIVAGGIILMTRFKSEQAVEISLPQRQELTGRIYIGGEVSSPGFYPVFANDSIDKLLQSAGGAGSSANLSGLELYVPRAGVGQGAQKIDINRAEGWLLEALPGIGPALAQRIIDYRQKNGLFNNTDELLKVPGIGAGTYEKFKNLITVADR